MPFTVALDSTTSYVDSQVITDIGSLLTSVLGWITSNSMLSIFFTISLVGIAIGLFRRLKKSVR